MSHKTKSKNIHAAWLAVSSGCLLLVGCRSVSTSNPGTPAIPTSPPPVSGRTVPDTMAAEASAEVVRHFNVRISSSGSGPVEAIHQSVEGRLAEQGYKIIADENRARLTNDSQSAHAARNAAPVGPSPVAEAIKTGVAVVGVVVTAVAPVGGGAAAAGLSSASDQMLGDGTGKRPAQERDLDISDPQAPDIEVRLRVRTSEFDSAGNYLRCEGTVEASVDRTWDQKRLGFKPLSVRGKRGLGADEAMRNLTAQLTEETCAFVVQAARPEQSGLAVMDVTIKRPWLTARDPEYAQRFIGAVRSQRGVIYCAMVAHDYETRVLTFRVVYLADAMPEGVLNRLATMKNLGIKPRN